MPAPHVFTFNTEDLHLLVMGDILNSALGGGSGGAQWTMPHSLKNLILADDIWFVFDQVRNLPQMAVNLEKESNGVELEINCTCLSLSRHRAVPICVNGSKFECVKQLVHLRRGVPAEGDTKLDVARHINNTKCPFGFLYKI